MGAIREIITKTLNALEQEGRPFTGCLFPGIILTKDGPKVLEFNARFGDPETQVYMRLLKTDLLEVLEAAATHQLHSSRLEWESGSTACIVLASGGYPGVYEKGLKITGLESITDPSTYVFHAGTAEEEGHIVTNGGRVLNLTSRGETLNTALETAYMENEKICFKGKQFRKDIGFQYIDHVPK
jgi:phosphoribosylamine--glycine ligase